MTLDRFRTSLASAEPPEGLPELLEALWWAGRGNWDRAHTLAQGVDTADGAWVHAYLHRRDGDRANASYWYRRAGKAAVQTSYEEEWAQITQALLERGK